MSASPSDRSGRMLVAREEDGNDAEHARAAKARARARSRRMRIKDKGPPPIRALSLEDDVNAVALALADRHDGGILSLGAALEIERIVDDLIVVPLPLDPAVHDRIAPGRV